MNISNPMGRMSPVLTCAAFDPFSAVSTHLAMLAPDLPLGVRGEQMTAAAFFGMLLPAASACPYYRCAFGRLANRNDSSAILVGLHLPNSGVMVAMLLGAMSSTGALVAHMSFARTSADFTAAQSFSDWTARRAGGRSGSRRGGRVGILN